MWGVNRRSLRICTVRRNLLFAAHVLGCSSLIGVWHCGFSGVPLAFVAPQPEYGQEHLSVVAPRRRALSVLGPLALVGVNPRDHQRQAVAEDGSSSGDAQSGQAGWLSPREALYEGKAASLRRASEWYRFFVGDLITRGTGYAAPDGLKSDDADCGGGLCAAAMALTSVGKLLSPGIRNGRPGMAQVEYELLTPMNTMVDMNYWDPDACDVGKDKVAIFETTVRKLRDNVRKKKNGDEAEALYTKSLQALNDFFQHANEAASAKPADQRYMPLVPLTFDGIVNDEYWESRREEYAAAMDPRTQFADRNALAPKDVRQGLKRFPGATLLLR